MVECKVCKNPIDISSKLDQHVVKCQNCNETTPIRHAPSGRKYVRCTCSCLLICKTTSQRIACPRPNCKNVISLIPFGFPPPTITSVPGMCRVACGHCHDTFLYNTESKRLVKCLNCQKFSSVGPEYSQKRAWLYCTLAFVSFVLTIGIIVATESSVSDHPGIYALYAVLFFALTLLLMNGIYFCKMKISFIEGAA